MKNIVDKILNYIYKFILIFTIICFSISLIGATFFYVNRSHNYLNPIILITGSIICLFLICKLYKFIIKLDDKSQHFISTILLILQFILLFISTRTINSIPQVDLIHILTGINSLNHTGTIINSEYFSVYPNNKFLLLILYGISKISPNNMNILFGLFNSACVTIMSLFIYKTVKKMSNQSNALVSLFLCVFSPIFYLYVSYNYTDIIMLPFASIIIYLIVSNPAEENTKKNILNCLLIGIFTIVGYKIRAVSIFLLIAYFVYLIFLKKIKNLIKYMIPIIISGIFTLCFINTVENKIFVDVDESKQFPLTHWIMMGVNLDHKGYYSQDDYNLSASVNTVSERKSLNIEQIKNRLQKQGFIGNVELAMTKLVNVWGKGDYSYQKYLELVKDYNFSYQYLLEDKNIIVNYILQFLQITILILCITSLINLFKKNEKSVIAISLFGAIVFYLIWEVCPRYGLSFLPWMIILSSYSYEKFDINLDKSRYYKYLKYSLLFITVIILSVGFIQYTKVDERSYLVSKTTVRKVKYIELDDDICLTQSLKLNSEFNEIKLKFRLNEKNIYDAIYRLELLNEQGKVVYKNNFLTTDLKNNEYTTFKLDKSYSKGKYTIRLSAETKGNLEVYVSYKEEFDYYPNGILSINDVEQAGDLMFEIKNIEEGPVFSYAEYFIIIVFVLGIEYIIFFRKEGKNK